MAKIPIVRWLGRLCLGGVFLYAGALKAFAPEKFADDLRAYHLFPEAVIFPLAAFLPYLEIVVGLALITGLLYPGALIFSGALLTAFTAALSSAAWRKLDISCGCFGEQAGSSVEGALLRGGALLILWFILAWRFFRDSVRTHAKETSSLPADAPV